MNSNNNIKELIDHIEKNFRDYYALLNSLRERKRLLEEQSEVEELRDFFAQLTTIEEEVIEYRLKKVINEEHPYLPLIHTENFNSTVYKEEAFLQIVEKFLKQRQELLKLLYSIPSNYWLRTGVHEEEGHITFQEFIRRMIEKDKANINFIKSIILNG